MHLNFAIEFELRDAPQVLSQDFFLDLELVLVAGVLVVASAAAAKIAARWLDAVRRRLHDCSGLGAREARLFFGAYRFDLFSSKNKGNKHSLAAPAVVGRKASESVAAIDQLFNI